jgi:hypothetical protein
MKALRRNTLGDLILLAAIVIISVAIRYEGWKSWSFQDTDMLPYYLGAETQLQTGAFLGHGDLSSYNSFAPPGTVYWILMGAAVMPDLRLYALPANLLLNLFSVILLYFLVRKTLDRRTALVSGLAYGISLLGYQSVWPIGHPLYILLILVFTSWWIQKRNPWAIFFAGVVGAFGLYVDLAILPFLFIPLVAWIFFRPPMRILPLIATVAVGLLIWLPYLRYEVARDFIDIRSILTLTRISSQNTLESRTAPPYCLATLPGEPDMRAETYIPYLGSASADRLVYPAEGIKPTLYYHACTFFLNIDRNFDGGYFFTPLPILGVLLWIVFMVGLFQAAAMMVPASWTSHRALLRFSSAPVWLVAGISLIVSGLLFLGVWFSLRYMLAGKDHAFLLVAQQAQYFLPLLFFSLCAGFHLGLQPTRRDPAKVFTVFALWIPWLVVVLLAEPGRPERFWWLWPLQVALAVMALFQIVDAWKGPRWIYWVLTIVVMVAMFPAPEYFPRIQEILTRGYSGPDSGQIHVVDFIGKETRGSGKSQVAIGYRFNGDKPDTAAADPSLWYGSWFNLMLQSRWQLENTDHVPAGISDADQWRIWTPPTLPCRMEDAQTLAWLRFKLVFQSGPYCLFERTD